MKKVVLRDARDEDGRRFLDASFDESGDLVIEGHDLGPGVEKALGPRLTEYEWIWKVRKADLPLLQRALGGDPLSELEKQFSGERAAGLYAFLEDNKVPFDPWSRIGD
jgi:hypothetical protein